MKKLWAVCVLLCFMLGCRKDPRLVELERIGRELIAVRQEYDSWPCRAVPVKGLIGYNDSLCLSISRSSADPDGVSAKEVEPTVENHQAQYELLLAEPNPDQMKRSSYCPVRVYVRWAGRAFRVVGFTWCVGCG